MELLDKYRGAAIYKVNRINNSEVEILGYKVKAEGMLPDPRNMKVDFIEEAENQKKALEGIKKKIDRYLDKHEMEEFVFEDHDR